jgi:hypothetical protein
MMSLHSPRPATLFGTVGSVISDNVPLACLVEHAAAGLVVEILRCVVVANSRKAMADVLDDSMSSQTIMLWCVTDGVAPAVDPQHRHVDCVSH